MVAKPPLPDGVDLPSPINGWVHDPNSNRNGHVWTGWDAARSVAVFSHFGTTVSVAVFDDRVGGFANRIEPVRRDIRDDESQFEAVAWGVERAVAWIRAHDEEMEEVVDPPAECGIAIAVNLAREYVRSETGRTRDAPAAGQADLGAWSP